MRIHILGVGGTFMAGLALLAKQEGFVVSGSDLNIYPPMSTQLAAAGITLYSGFDPSHLESDLDYVIVGNVIRRGNPLMEYVLNQSIPYLSGPEWLAKTILKNRHVLAVSGTHGKTTTTSLLAWILDYAGLHPGFLIGGVPENFGISARIGQSPFFVIEADEYDSAFFDKRPKFIHYHPKTLILNNLEYDHADIYPDLAAIKQQFHYLIRTVPGNGLIIQNDLEENLKEVIAQGVWTNVVTFGSLSSQWQAVLHKDDGSSFAVFCNKTLLGDANWPLLGKHNVQNALAALAAATSIGVPADKALEALSTFKNVKRRLEIRGKVGGVTLYDDFAHHPTAIATTLAGLRAKIGKERMIAVTEFGSYTMRTGVHKDQLPAAFKEADLVLCQRPSLDNWNVEQTLRQFSQPYGLYDTVDHLVANLSKQLKSGDHIVVLSNSGFDGIHEKLLQVMNVRFEHGETASK